MNLRLALCIVLVVPPATPLGAQSSSRTLTGVIGKIEAHQREISISQRLQEGLPVEHLPEVSFAAAQREGHFATQALAELAPVKERELSLEERLTLRTMRWQLALDAEEPKYFWLSFSDVTPYATVLQAVAQAFAGQQFNDGASVAGYFRLLQQVPSLVDSIRAGLAERARRGVRIPRDELPLVLAVLRGYRQTPESSAYFPALPRLQHLEAPLAQRVRADGARLIADAVNPAFDRLIGYIDGAEYRDRAPKKVGLWQYAGGRAYYRYLVRRHTTMDIAPRQVHEVGQREVRRIELEMAAIRRELGFNGSATEFVAGLRKDPRFYATTPEEVGARLASYIRRIEPVTSLFFSATPRAKGDARRLDPRLEPAMTFGYYQPPTAQDSMGHYFFNGSQLSERSLITAAPLIYHELIPGHHYQIARQLENAALPALRRNSYITAFNEGWGEYASGLAGEMGMYVDPYERYGRLFMDMFLSCRLVVDTGMNELGWSRDSAKAFMAARVIESPAQLETETLRYSVDLPGQALAYKMGSIEITRLRDWSKTTLGSRFDIRAFHEVALGSGALPISVLVTKVEEWVREQGKGSGK